MTAKDLAVVVRGIAPVMREYVAGLVDRVKALEDRPVPQDGAQGPPGESITGSKGDKGDRGERGPEGPAGPARDGRDGLPGVPGTPGEKGLDGQHGTNGVDGLGFDDLSVEFDGERTIALAFTRGDVVKRYPIALPFLKYEGVYLEGKEYVPGDVITWGGNAYHCRKRTGVKPDFVGRGSDGAPLGPQGKDFWTLIVKSGGEGRPGRDGKDGMPGKSGKDWNQK